MPHYISAYDLQHRDGLTRQRVLELAEDKPESTFLRDGREYLEKGIEKIKPLVISDWLSHGNRFIENSEYRCEHREKGLCEQIIESDYDRNKKKICENSKNGLCELEVKYRCEEHISNRFPDSISGEVARKLFDSNCPQEIKNNLDKKFLMHTLVDLVGYRRMVKILFYTHESWRKSREDIWKYLSAKAEDSDIVGSPMAMSVSPQQRRKLGRALKSSADRHGLPYVNDVIDDRTIRNWLKKITPPPDGFSAEIFYSQRSIERFAERFVLDKIEQGRSSRPANQKRDIPLNDQTIYPINMSREERTLEIARMIQEQTDDRAEEVRNRSVGGRRK